MTKIVYNACFGGFSLSEVAFDLYHKYGGKAEWDGDIERSDIERDDPILVRVVEELGVQANGSHADLAIRELPKGTKYIIHEYDGNENVVTIDEFNWKTA